MTAMPRDGAIIFSDLIGKLDMLRVECPRTTATRRVVCLNLLHAPEKIAGSPFNVALAARKSLGAVGKVPLEQARVQAGTFLAHVPTR
jgi:hypothetical protein